MDGERKMLLIIMTVNSAMAELAEKDPAQVTYSCNNCGQSYVARKLADLSVCPLCGQPIKPYSKPRVIHPSILQRD